MTKHKFSLISDTMKNGNIHMIKSIEKTSPVLSNINNDR